MRLVVSVTTYENDFFLDKDKDGRVRRREFRKVLDTFPFKLTEDQFTNLMCRVDPEGKGFVSYHEFLRTFERKESEVILFITLPLPILELFLLVIHSSSLSLECALRESGCRIGYEPTKMIRDHFWRSISRDTNVEVSALSPLLLAIEWDNNRLMKSYKEIRPCSMPMRTLTIAD